MPEKKSQSGRRPSSSSSAPSGRKSATKSRRKASPKKVEPKVSCLLPTRDRRQWIPAALIHFQRQTWEQRELLVIDDGEDDISDLIPADDPRIRYLRLGGPMTLGAKRNLCCEEATGDILVHWDDDDWMADRRLSYQVGQLTAAGVEVCGLDRLYFCEPATLLCWQYVYQGKKPWVAGGTLCFTKAFWRNHAFPELAAGEDTRFLWQHRPKDLLRLDDPSFYCAVIHADNTSSKPIPSAPRQPREFSEMRGQLGERWADFIEILRKGGVEGRRRAQQRPETTTHQPHPHIQLRRGQRAAAVIRCRVS